MKILFLDQSGKPGGAELCLLDIAKPYRDRSMVGLFADGSFRDLLEKQQIHVQVLTDKQIQVRKESSLVQGLNTLGTLVPLIAKVVQLSRRYDLIYANTQKALVVGAIASFISRRPLVYHLHDILSVEHFSQTNRLLAITLANKFASLVIANSQASKTAFIEAGGRTEIVEIIYNGFEPKLYQTPKSQAIELRQQLGWDDKFIVGHFSRLSPWKGQHILIEALAGCPENVTVILVGDALFGEQEYVQKLHQQIAQLGLEKRVQFLGFRSDVIPLMAACDVVAHTSTAAEPFGRVIVEAMLCGRPVIAAKAGGAMELVETGETGWLVAPGDANALAEMITKVCYEPEIAKTIAERSQQQASLRFNLDTINQQLSKLLDSLV